MPKHLAIDTNYISGTVHLEGTKTATVNYYDSQGNAVLFTKAPRLQLTLLNQATAVPFKTANVKTGALFSGFMLGFQTVQTIDVEWVVSERE